MRRVMDEPLTIREGVIIPGWELWFTASRSGGPGGQHVNTSSTRVTLHWAVATTTALDERQRARVVRRLANRINADGVLQINGDGQRSQHQNVEEARRRLAELVDQALEVPKRRIATRPSRASKVRRLEAKKQRGELKRQRKDPDI